MCNAPPEIGYGATEAVADVHAVRLPLDPVEGGVVAAAVRAELQLARLGERVVGVVDADEGCALATARVVYNLQR